MQCERAQEFFSDYLERTLDRPMTVALEAHLGSCARCRDEVEIFQETMLSLDSLPELAPPADGAWQVMSRIRSARAEQWEAQRRRPAPFFDWLRGLNPASAAMGAGLATLVIAGTVMTPNVSNVIRNAFGWGPPVARNPILAPGADRPTVRATYLPQFRQVNIEVTPRTDLPGAEIRLDMNGQTTARHSDGFGLAPNQTMVQPIILPAADREAEAIWVTVRSETKNKEYRYLVALPLQGRTQERVTLLLDGRPVEEVLRQIAPYAGRPIVLEGAVDSPVTLNVAGETAAQCLEGVARQLGTRVSAQPDGYHLVPAP